MHKESIASKIRKYYLELLLREPDDDGFNYYFNQLQEKTLTESQIIESIKNSPEYLKNNPKINPNLEFSKDKDYVKNFRIIALYRLKNESRWIEQSLQSVINICDEIIILDDGSTDDTVKICERFPQVVYIHSQKNLPFDETRDKNTLLKIALQRNPDFILTLDGDEILMLNSKQHLFHELNVLYPNITTFEFKGFYIWDKPNQYRCDGIFNNTWPKKLFRLNGQPKNLRFAETNFPGNAHCAAVPDNLIETESSIRSKSCVILHYGYYDKKLRLKKFNFLNKLDPHNVDFDGYKHIFSGNSKFSGTNGMEFKLISQIDSWFIRYFK
jgi:glycosyltransferase involved in cell wall biosynthesis